jgi:hypothetical protein
MYGFKLWVGAKPRPAPLSNNTTFKFKYKNANPYDKEHWREYWLADMCQGFTMGEVRGSNPADSHKILHITIHMNQPDSDTWRQWVGPRVHTLLAINDTCQHSIGQPPSNKNMPHHQTATSTVWSPHHHYGTALHMAVRTVRTGTVSIPNFCLFGLADRSRYLLHTDSVCESKYTAGIRKTRRTQWHHFRRNPSTLKIEQIFAPWSRF